MVIPIPEERLSAKLRQLLTEHLGEVLETIEAEQDDGVKVEDLRCIATDADEPSLSELPSASILIKKGELSEKDRILKNEVYVLYAKIGFAGREQAKQAYRYAAAVGRLLETYPTLYGACRRAVLKEKEYQLSRLPGDTDTGSVRLSIRAVVERL